MKNTKIINLFGQPSAGKSTTAAGVFHKMKLADVDCEIITEYAKEMVWRGLPAKAFSDQLYITAKQNQRQLNLLNKVDYVVTDSPLLTGLAYVPEDYFESYKPLLLEIFNSYDNVNFFLNRTKPYNPIGRNQTEDEATAISHKIRSILQKERIPFIEIDGNSGAADKILQMLK
jgi:adenylate kinase family enzyme